MSERTPVPVIAIIQARLTSTRLPGKVLKAFGAHPVLWHIVQRTKAVTDGVIVAIPTTPTNDPLAAWLRERAIPFIRGPEDDVLARYVIAAAAVENPDAICLRITSDCPLLDAGWMRSQIRVIWEHGAGYSYNRGGLGSGDPARGLDVEAFTARELFRLASLPDLSAYEREHVTPRWRRPERIHEVSAAEADPTHGMRWTLDTEEDYAWFCRLAQHVNTEPPHPTTEEVLDYIAKTGDVLYEPEA